VPPRPSEAKNDPIRPRAARHAAQLTVYKRFTPLEKKQAKTWGFSRKRPKFVNLQLGGKQRFASTLFFPSSSSLRPPLGEGGGGGGKGMAHGMDFFSYLCTRNHGVKKEKLKFNLYILPLLNLIYPNPRLSPARNFCLAKIFPLHSYENQ